MMWHLKLGYMSEQGLKILSERKLLPGLKSVSLPFCEHCVTSKQHRLKFSRSIARSKCILDLIHSDVWESPDISMGGVKYMVTFIDDYSKRCWVYPIKKKSDVFLVFKEYKARVELESGKKIKCLRTDNGGEYTDGEFLAFCKQEAIRLKTAMEMWTVKPADYSYLHAFGCPVYVMYNAQERTKLDPKSRRCIFLGYADGVKGYRLWDPTAHKIVISRDVIFVEDQLQMRDEDDGTKKEKSETVPVYVENNPEDSDSSEAAPEHKEQEPVESETPEVCWSTRERRPPTWHLEYVTKINVAYCLLTEDEEPSTFHEALEKSDVTLWMTAMQEEIEALHKNKTWELVPLPHERKAIGNKWVFKIKRDGNDQVERYRARLVVKGYAHKECINFNEIFSPVAPRHWYKRFDSFIMSLGYNRLNSDHCAYYKRFKDNDFIILLLYVDDMLVAGPNKDRVQELKAQLAREFEMKDLGPANKILGMQIHRDRNNRKIWLSQKNYLKKILRRFNMQDCKSISAPLPVNFKLSSSMCPRNEAERKEMSRVPYASAVGSLMFTMICTRPDIAQAVGAVSRYMANPGGEHWIAVKRILRYIRGTSDVVLCYRGSEFTIRGYVDSDFAGDLDKRKSTTGYVFTLAGAVVSWVSKLQTVVALSTTEAEYMAATQACKEAIWMQRLLEELGHKQEKIYVFCDNQSALHIARNLAFHSKTKHIGVQCHFVREVVEDESVDLQKIHTKENLADVLTKSINADKFIWSRSSCGLAET
ncbi:Integrase catalytic domain-containing protein [Citrus sinensis]|nr:Integrase catalytic domain-containing protein [Citrus sinensis]